MPEDDYVIEIGKADIKREGTDVTVITYGRMLQSVEEAKRDSIKRKYKC